MSKGKVVLAYSGGLDTSCILKWLLEQDYEVICYMANIGQEEDFEAAERKATKIGASRVVIEDLREVFVKNYVWPSIQAGLIYESRYLLGTSLARPCISRGIVRCAQENNARYISHGCTGKGNDQVRFELSCYSLWPECKVIAPWRDEDFIKRFQGRQDLLKYAADNNIPVSATTKAPWSMDANLMHISYESGILENPFHEPPKDLFQMTKPLEDTPNRPFKLQIEFQQGIPVQVVTADRQIFDNPLDIFLFLNKIGGLHSIGRIDIVENRFIGLKSRGVYETPGGFILYTAHKDLEVFSLDREVYRLKELLKDKLSDYVYNGFWFSPEAKFVFESLSIAERDVNGVVNVELFKGNVSILGRTSPKSIYNEELVSMNSLTSFSPVDATGFINIHALRLKEYHRFNNSQF